MQQVLLCINRESDDITMTPYLVLIQVQLCRYSDCVYTAGRHYAAMQRQRSVDSSRAQYSSDSESVSHYARIAAIKAVNRRVFWVL